MPSGSTVMAPQSLAAFSAAPLAWNHLRWPQGGRAGFCRSPLALPELPTPSSLALGPAVTTFNRLES